MTNAMIRANGSVRRGFFTSPPISASASSPDQVTHPSTTTTMNMIGPLGKSGTILAGFAFTAPVMPKMVMPIRSKTKSITCSQAAKLTPMKLITAKNRTMAMASTHGGSAKAGLKDWMKAITYCEKPTAMSTLLASSASTAPKATMLPHAAPAILVTVT